MSQLSPIYFTYRLTHIPSGKHYYGAKFGKDSNPNILWITYFTSSKIVKELIEKDGTNSFQFEIRKTFANPKKCFEWETKVLRRLKIPKNKNWLNESKNEKGLNGYFAMKYKTKEHRRKISETKKGQSYGEKFKETMKRVNKGRNQGIDNPNYNKDNNAKMWKIVDPDGKEYIIRNLVKFCKQHGLSRRNMGAVANGRQKTCKKWKCFKFDELQP